MRWIRSLFKRNQVNSLNAENALSSTSNVDQKIIRLSADNPITKPEDDALGRFKPASSFATQILSLDASEGVVVGVLGAWGSGKTSFVNLAQSLLKKSGVTVLEFNPWMFSGADQLVQSFFIELSAQLKLRPGMSEIGKRIEEYGESFSGLGWLPLVGPWVERGKLIADIVAKSFQRKKEGVKASQSKVREALEKLHNPIVVILDDIDRLSTPEIRDVFKLVRLTANFPNIIYLLAFDRYRVEQALGEQGIPGRDYLEKILQIGVDLPSVPDHVLNSQIFKAIDGALEAVENPGHFDSDLWPDVFMEVIQPLIRNMRDVRRYAASIHGTVRDLEGQVALVDVLALEAIRVFLPDVFYRLRLTVEALTATANGFGAGDEAAQLKEQVDTFVEAAGDRAECVRNLIRRVFPGGERHLGGMHYGGDWRNGWLRERRVAHEDILRYYLERVVGEQLQAFSDAEAAWAKITDKNAFENYLKSLPVERVQDVISSLEAYEDEFSAEHAVPGSVVLLNLLPKLPDRQRGMFDLNTNLVVGRVIYRLVRALNERETVEAAVKEILTQVKPLSSKQQLITTIGYREGAGHKLVSETAASSFEADLRTEIRNASPEDLARETDLLRTLLLTKRESTPDEPELIVPDSPQVTCALLKSARSELISQSMNSRAVRRKPRLAWDMLIDIYGSEEKLREQLEALKACPPEDVGDLLELADLYLSGRRPNEIDDD
ncbi:KAP family P-loop NTPase fold protein [Idiomarina abyssalis]|uniref:KAP family P-loop NTPase fold protein n=1 Tax=Idiomarina abyssalis TaxID=86102 RepID=UPI003A92AC32